MLVDVIELFWLGEKLSRDARRQLKPVRGQLTVDRRWTHDRIENAPLYADLVPYQLETLCNVRLRFCRGRNLVLSGQQLGRIPGQKRSETHYEQWWWCRIVTESSPPEPRQS